MSKKFEGSVAPRERINISYVPKTDGQTAEVELPLNMLVVGDTLLSTEGAPHYPGMTHRHQLADTVVNGFSADPLQALQSESLITTGDPLSGIAADRAVYQRLHRHLAGRDGQSEYPQF